MPIQSDVRIGSDQRACVVRVGVLTAIVHEVWMDCRSGADVSLAVTNSNPKSRSRGGGGGQMATGC
jgi:hypothetical protein